jgi:uroporphyrinogen decarboxylase
MNKREAVLNVLEGKPQEYIPAGFFLHFDPQFHQGEAAVEKHLEFFRFTDMDFVKIQYERTFPPRPELVNPGDWRTMPVYGLDFYSPQLAAVEGLVQAARDEALVLVTLYSPFMCAGHTVGEARLMTHIQEDSQAVNIGMQRITESLLIFVQECIRLGVDGFYASTQGGEQHRFTDPDLFELCVRPYDLVLMEEINRACQFNILHVCDYRMKYSDLSPFTRYPGHVVNTSLELVDRRIDGKEVSQLFNRLFMGGLDRLGIVATGTPEQIRQEVSRVIKDSPVRFILGADCTVPSQTPWENLRLAIELAHLGYGR